MCGWVCSCYIVVFLNLSALSESILVFLIAFPLILCWPNYGFISNDYVSALSTGHPKVEPSCEHTRQ